MQDQQSQQLISVRAKIGRAQSHLDGIKTALKLTLETMPETYPVASQTDPNRQEIAVFIPKAESFDPKLFSLLIGDCIHNLRSALDHLVYQLAVSNGISDQAASKTFFPVCKGKADFDKAPQKLVKPYISIPAFAEIERSQPYSAYDIPDEADIWILHKLDIIDKHRLLLVAHEKFAATEFTVTVPDQPPLHQVIPDPKWKSMEDGAEIVRFALSTTDRPSKVNVKTKIGRTVLFVNTGLGCDGMPVVVVLDQFMALVRAIVRDFGKQFFDE